MKYFVGYEDCPIGIYEGETENDAIKACKADLSYLDMDTRKRILSTKDPLNYRMIAVKTERSLE